MRLGCHDFKDAGGWLVDTQAFDSLRSSCLLAHGLGTPVPDAVASLDQMTGGSALNGLNVWALTRDWVPPNGPGQFVVNIVDSENGMVVWKSSIFGKARGDWHWENGGCISGLAAQRRYALHLHDLTGFDARCAGVVLQVKEDAAPFNVAETIRSGTRFDCDFVVVGGGYAGMCAAVAAARRGVKVALVQDRPVWGGNASCEVRVGPIGGLGLKPFPRNSDLAYELMELTHVEGGRTSGGLRPVIDNDKLEAWLRAEKNLMTFPCTRLVEAQTADSSRPPYQREITSVVCLRWDCGEYIELWAPYFADCTGDGALAVLAGADYREAAETKAETGEELATEGTSKGGYGSTNFWTTRWTDHETTFPSCPWALQIDETNWQVNRPKFFVEGDFPYAAGWNWESGFDRDVFEDGEAIRDYNLRAAYGMWDYLKNKAPDRARYAKAEMDWLGYVLGKRAARRILGDYILCEQDLTQHRDYPDGVVTCTWFLDLHFPHPTNVQAFPEGAFRSMAYDDPLYATLVKKDAGRQIKIAPYAIPFRCFYSRNVSNLWMAGKDISCTHVAMSSVRVENTTAQMGSMIGTAVSLCLQHEWSPRELGVRHFAVLAAALQGGLPVTSLAKRGNRRYQNRVGLKNEIKYWLRPMVRWLKRLKTKVIDR